MMKLKTISKLLIITLFAWITFCIIGGYQLATEGLYTSVLFVTIILSTSLIMFFNAFSYMQPESRDYFGA